MFFTGLLDILRGEAQEAHEQNMREVHNSLPRHVRPKACGSLSCAHEVVDGVCDDCDAPSPSAIKAFEASQLVVKGSIEC